MDEPLPFPSAEYFVLFLLLCFARGMDFLSTWVATPRLVLEGNPLAKMIGWRMGVLVNLILCLTFALWELTAVIISTTSLLVAARNFQNAWLMRTLGEEEYRDWFVEKLNQTPLPIYLYCLLGQTLLTGLVGAGLVLFSGVPGQVLLIPFSIGLGIVGYALTVLFYTLLSIWRIRRAQG